MKNPREKRTGKIGQKNYEILIQMIYEGKNAIDLSDFFQVAPETIRKFARKRGLKIQRVDMTMENHPSWNGGYTFDRSGYKLIRVLKDGDHGYLIRANTRNDPNGYAPEHRIVMHNKLGRPLQAGEVVDHIDGDLRNNHPDNLRVFPSNAEHLKETLKGKRPNWTPDGFYRMRKLEKNKQPVTLTPNP